MNSNTSLSVSVGDTFMINQYLVTVDNELNYFLTLTSVWLRNKDVVIPNMHSKNVDGHLNEAIFVAEEENFNLEDMVYLNYEWDIYNLYPGISLDDWCVFVRSTDYINLGRWSSRVFNS